MEKVKGRFARLDRAKKRKKKAPTIFRGKENISRNDRRTQEKLIWRTRLAEQNTSFPTEQSPPSEGKEVRAQKKKERNGLQVKSESVAGCGSHLTMGSYFLLFDHLLRGSRNFFLSPSASFPSFPSESIRQKRVKTKKKRKLDRKVTGERAG